MYSTPYSELAAKILGVDIHTVVASRGSRGTNYNCYSSKYSKDNHASRSTSAFPSVGLPHSTTGHSTRKL